MPRTTKNARVICSVNKIISLITKAMAAAANVDNS